MVLLRFAPSPTGALHLGGLRTALLNHVVSRQLGGKWILRIEDTDRTRLVPGSVDNIRSGLEWAGLEYDRAPTRDGLYYQSERLDLYQQHAQKLLDNGFAYRCFCSPSRLDETRTSLQKAGSNATYDRKCLHLSEEESIRRMKAGERHVVRLKDGSVTVNPNASSSADLVFGKLAEATSSLPTDSILVKSDSFPTYHLASVVDDNDMGITHVLRGEEWLASLPLHLQLYAALGIQPPKFAHIPLLLNPDGTKMSKRKGDVRVSDYIEKGWEPEGVVNWLALAGWGREQEAFSHSQPTLEPSSLKTDGLSPARHADVFSLDELIKEFDLSQLTHRRNILDPTKLAYLNRHHLQRKVASSSTQPTIVERTRDILTKSFPESRRTEDKEYVGQALPYLTERISNLTEIPTYAPYLFIEPDYTSTNSQKMLKSLHQSRDEYTEVLTSSITALSHILPTHEGWTHGSIHDALEHVRLANGWGQKRMMGPLRHVLTAQNMGPSVVDTMFLLGRDMTLNRMGRASLAGALDSLKQ